MRAGQSSSTGSSRRAVRVRVDQARAGRYARAASRWAGLLVPRRTRPGLRVFYGHDRVPAAGEAVAGGTAKFQRLAGRFPNHPTDFTLLYLSTTWLPRDLAPLLALVRRRGVPVVLNQNGVAYPGWAGAATEEINRPYRRALLAADRVLYRARAPGSRRTPSSVSLAAPGRSSTTPSTSTTSHPRTRLRPTAPSCSSAATDAGLRLERKLPGEARVVDRAEVADRQAHPEVARVAPGLEQEDAAGRIGAQPVGEQAAGRAAADDK